MKTANQTEPHSSVKTIIEIHPNQMWFLRFLIWIGSICDFTFGLIQI
jgi:hypothetical protein